MKSGPSIGISFFRALSEKELSKDAEENIQKEYGVLFSSVQKTAAVLSLKACEGDREAAAASISGLCSEHLKDGLCFKNVNKEDELVLLLWKEKNPLAAAEEFIRLVKQKLKLNVLAAAGSTGFQLNETFGEAEAVLLTHDLRLKKRLPHQGTKETNRCFICLTFQMS